MFAFAMLAAVAGATPARAAATDEGWFVFLDLANAQPVSLDQHFANHLDTSGVSSVADRLVIDNDADLAFKVGAGFGFGTGNGSLRVSYWSFDNEDEQSGTVVGGLYPTIFGYGYNGGGMYLYSTAPGVLYTATSSVKASTIDVDYVRELVGGEKASLAWLAGLRVATWEEDQGFEGNDGALYFQEKHFESDGIGLRVGAGADFQFTKHFGIKSSLVFSFLQADTEGESSQTFGAGVPPSDIFEASDDNIKGEMRDFDVKAVWTYGMTSFWVGYMASEWEGMVTDPLPQNDGGHFAIGPADNRSRDSVGFNSLHAGVALKFGGKKK